MSTTSRVDLDQALESIAPNVRRAFELSHEALRGANIAHVVIGGLAVNAHGHHYSTHDVDYLVDARDAFDGTLVMTHKAGVPFHVGGVDIDYVTADPRFPAMVLQGMADAVERARHEPLKCVVVQDWLLVWMKLNAGRTKDRAAVEGLLAAGLDAESVRQALMESGDSRVVTLFDRCVQSAGV